MAETIESGFVGRNLSLFGLSPLAYGIAETCNALKSYVWDPPKLAIAYEDAKVEVDIVFVHGFGGAQRETWTCRKGRQKVYWWNKDYLNKDVRNIRVLVYGYRVTPDVLEHFSQTIREESKLLVDCLEQRRRGIQSNRPLIFIAHGLGGLIVKAALIHTFESSVEQQSCKNTFHSTRAVLFYGTPHQRTSQSLGKRIAQVAARTLKKNCDKSLENDADLLALQLDRYKSLDRHFRNCSFYRREKGSKVSEAPQWISWKVVPLDKPLDSCVNIESTEDKAYSHAVLFIIDACKAKLSRPGDFEWSVHLEPSRQLREADELSRANKFKEAEFKFHQELSCSEDRRGLCEPYILLILSFQAQHYCINNANDKALCCYRRIYLTILANYSTFTPARSPSEPAVNHLKLSSANQDLIHGARILASKQQYHEAIRFLELAQQLVALHRGPKHRATVMLSAHIATLYTALGRFDDADEIYTRLRAEEAETLTAEDIVAIMRKQDFISGQRQLLRSHRARRWNTFYALFFDDEDGLPPASNGWVMALTRSMSVGSFEGDLRGGVVGKGGGVWGEEGDPLEGKLSNTKRATTTTF